MDETPEVVPVSTTEEVTVPTPTPPATPPVVASTPDYVAAVDLGVLNRLDAFLTSQEKVMSAPAESTPEPPIEPMGFLWGIVLSSFYRRFWRGFCRC